MHQPHHLHLVGVKRIIHYLLRTYYHGIFYKVGSLLILKAYSDVD